MNPDSHSDIPLPPIETTSPSRIGDKLRETKLKLRSSASGIKGTLKKLINRPPKTDISPSQEEEKLDALKTQPEEAGVSVSIEGRKDAFESTEKIDVAELARIREDIEAERTFKDIPFSELSHAVINPSLLSHEQRKLLLNKIKSVDNAVLTTALQRRNLRSFRYLQDLQVFSDETRKMASDFIRENVPIIDDVLSGDNQDNFLIWMGTDIVTEVLNEDIVSKESLLDFQIKHLLRALGGIDETFSDVIPTMYKKLLLPLFKYGNSEQTEQVRDTVIVDLLHSENASVRSNAVELVGDLLTDQDKNVRFNAENIMGIQMLLYDLDPQQLEQITERWALSNLGENSSVLYKDNFKVACALEDKRPGIVKVLFSEFGIADFARYPPDLLIKQYDQRDNKDLPYGIVAYPVYDHNGVFYTHVPVLQKLHDQLGDDYQTRVYEVGSSLDLVHAINKSRHKYGQMEFAILGGHGASDSIQLGYQNQQKNTIEMTDLNKKGADAIGQAFTPHPTIILVSCTTGELGGIGQKISSLGSNQAEVIAPRTATNIIDLDVVKNDGRLAFSVKYVDEKSREIYSGGNAKL